MRSRTAAALLSALGVVTGGAIWALPGLAGATPLAAVVDSTVPDDEAPDTTTTDDTTTDGTTDETGADATEPAIETSSRSSRIEEALQPLVDDGTLTEDQASAVVDALAETRFGTPGRHVRMSLVDAAALTETLGLSIDELHDAVAEGQTIAEIAEAQDVAIEDLVAALVAAATERIEEAVADGRLSDDEAATLIDDLTERITERLEAIEVFGPTFAGGADWPGRQNGERRRFEGRGPHWPSGQLPAGGPLGPAWSDGVGGPDIAGDGPGFGDGGTSGSNAPGDTPSSTDTADTTAT